MATYTYLAADARTNAILAELPATGVNFEDALAAIPTWSATLPLADVRSPLASTTRDAYLRIMKESVQPGRTAIYVDRDGVLVWGGLLFRSSYRSDDNSLALSAAGFVSYLRRRRIRQDLTFTQIDQLAIAQTLVELAQSIPGGSLGIQVVPAASGVLRDRSFQAVERKNLGEAVEELAAVENGFDLAVDVAYDSNGQPAKYLTLSYPRRGRPAGQNGLLFELPGNIDSYELEEDASLMASTWDALGSGTGDSQLVATAADNRFVDSGFPVYEDVATFSDVLEQATLDAHARADLRAHLAPVQHLTINVDPGKDPELGSYIVGDEPTVRISDDRFPRPAAGGVGLDTSMRIIAMRVTPGDSGQRETATLTLGSAA